MNLLLPMKPKCIRRHIMTPESQCSGKSMSIKIAAKGTAELLPLSY